MLEVTEDNYNQFLTLHGLRKDCAEIVVAQYDNTENYHNLISVRQWVEASKYVLKGENSVILGI
jgi:hypothetical protein